MGNVTITCICPLCGNITYVSCKESQWNAYENGALAQDVFADLTVCAREAIISGMCPDCQEAFYSEDEEDDDNPCDGECDICTNTDCPSCVDTQWGDEDDLCGWGCALCQHGDDCPLSDNY